MSVGSLIRHLREQAGWSQRELERRSGVRRAVIRDLENDVRANPGVVGLQRLAQVFEVSIEMLLAGEIPEEELISSHA